jgi:hypothetical protein
MATLNNYPLATLATVFIGLIAGCEGKSEGVPPETVSDYVRTVVLANRATYQKEVVERLENVENVIKASEHFKEDKTLPLTAQMIIMSAQRLADKGGVRYSLESLWPISKANAPKTDVEKNGLESVLKNPDTPYRSYQTIDGKKYLLTIYSEKATSLVCVECHNKHKDSPRRDLALGEVMGGLAVYVPLE